MQMKKKYPLVVYFFLANTFFHRSRNKRYLLTRKAYRRFGRLHERGCTSHLIIAADFCRKFKRYGFEIHAALESTLPLNKCEPHQITYYTTMPTRLMDDANTVKLIPLLFRNNQNLLHFAQYLLNIHWMPRPNGISSFFFTPAARH